MRAYDPLNPLWHIIMLQTQSPQANAIREGSNPRTVIHRELPKKSGAVVKRFDGRLVNAKRFGNAFELLVEILASLACSNPVELFNQGLEKNGLALKQREELLLELSCKTQVPCCFR